MKHILNIIVAAALFSSSAFAADSAHTHKAIPGPKGGKVLESTPLHAEFFVQPDRKVSITFYDEAMKPVAPSTQEIKVIAEPKTGKAILEIEKAGDAFVSKTALPEGDGYRVVVQIKTDAAAKPQNFRIDYHTEICKECKRAEYACTCEHAEGGDHSGHGH
jgi:hypothetical protein